jgi:hypothetical protein
MFSRARATMAMPKLFKTSRNGRSKHLHLEGADLRHNPILVAHNEYKIASTGSVVEIEYPDVVLSLGTGLTATSSQNSKESEKISIISRLKRQGSTKTQQRHVKGEISVSPEPGDSWDEYMNRWPISAPTSRFVRLNPEFKEELLVSEDTATVESMQRIVQDHYATGNQIKRLTAQLFATLFYFECSDTVLGAENNEVTVQGKQVHFLQKIFKLIYV